MLPVVRRWLVRFENSESKALNARAHQIRARLADQPFRKEIGSGLFLSLVPITSTDSTGFGWQIEVKPGDESDDFMRCITEPIHGLTPADLLAWQFVTEANEKLSDSELSPLKTRRFQFVLNAADQKKVCDELEEAKAFVRGTGKWNQNSVDVSAFKKTCPTCGTRRTRQSIVS